jgi:putative oxidoreductase
MSLGLLIARLMLGLALSAHGAQKLFGWFGGYGIKGTGGFFESLGYRPGAPFAVMAGLAEFGGGLLTALGLLHPLGPALIIIVMLNAMATVHWKNGFFASNNGIELTLMIIAGALALTFAGAGAYSLDAWLGITLFATEKAQWIIVGAAVVLALLNLVIRRPSPLKTAAQT